MPTVAIVPDDELTERNVAALHEIAARGGSARRGDPRGGRPRRPAVPGLGGPDRRTPQRARARPDPDDGGPAAAGLPRRARRWATTSTSPATWPSRSRSSDPRGLPSAGDRTPLADLLAAVPSLNDPQPAVHLRRRRASKIVGTWDIVKATSLYPTEVTHVDKDYRLEVELDEDEHTFDYEDHESETDAPARRRRAAPREGVLQRQGRRRRSSRFEFGGVNKTDEGVSVAPVVYSFDTDKIKDPLFGFLEQHGWERRRGSSRSSSAEAVTPPCAARRPR